MTGNAHAAGRARTSSIVPERKGQLVMHEPKDIQQYLTEGVEAIGDYAFNLCEELESVDLREGLVRIGNTAFKRCEKLRSVTIPRTVKSIGSNAFRFCKGLENLVIPDVEIEIGEDAFNYCGDIPNIDIPERILKTIKFSSSDEDETDVPF